MVQKDVLRGWHSTCNVERNWDGLEQNEANGRDSRKCRLYFRHGLRGRFIKGGFILTVIEREVARRAARQNAYYVRSSVRSSEEHRVDDDVLICETCRCMALKVSCFFCVEGGAAATSRRRASGIWIARCGGKTLVATKVNRLGSVKNVSSVAGEDNWRTLRKVSEKSRDQLSVQSVCFVKGEKNSKRGFVG